MCDTYRSHVQVVYMAAKTLKFQKFDLTIIIIIIIIKLSGVG